MVTELERTYGEPVLSPILVLNRKHYYYFYDIRLEEDVIDEEGKSIKQCSYILLYMTGVPNYKDCVTLIIRKHLTVDEEFDLINSYNRNGKSSDYTHYLELLDTIKNKVKKDFGIL